MSEWRSPTIRRLVNSIPFDGCLLVFNAPVNTWYSQVYRHCTGILGVKVINGTWQDIRAKRVINKPVNLYVYWKA